MLLLISIILSIIFLASFVLTKSKKKLPLTYSAWSNSLRENKTSIFKDNNFLLYFTFFLFLILPFFWGLSFYLRTDANVVVVLIGFTWIYNWVKYIFQLGKA
ncbi:MAG: hypothetical protein SFU98_03090 [Leptospiraceae bacterium]|nr:hypothetical protein [Leptospiraceae bacterium]